ncbi:helix-turn-helix domain-containing protein [Nitrospirillum pindoramense]|uniref:Helix-turn-helix protein n=1 Tax=Nitrospirillum amazonense TaxID=28077 RepID=A0A560H8G9_9PROT|nr:helix-turn-helix domain-containing protein [Nitrospirillum amazonense]TWB42598.1 helix-turn-helix protein [Nitrospirillum amazonense]
MQTAHSPVSGARLAAQNIGKLLRAARLRQRASQDEIARLAAISPEMLAQIEQGNTTTPFGAYVSVLYAVGLGSALAFITDEEDAQP